MPDFYFLERLARRRERLPKRAAHAKGFNAKGFNAKRFNAKRFNAVGSGIYDTLTVPPSIPKYTKIKPRGAADAEHDMRGFCRILRAASAPEKAMSRKS